MQILLRAIIVYFIQMNIIKFTPPFEILKWGQPKHEYYRTSNKIVSVSNRPQM